jgi:hypothetical protein
MDKKNRMKILKKALNISDEKHDISKEEISEEAWQKAHEIYVELIRNMKIKGIDY